MPKVENAKNLKAFFFPQDESGATDPTVSGRFAACKFSTQNAIPTDCRVTGFDLPSPSVATREADDIEAENDWIEYETDKISPGQATLNVDRAIDVAGVIDEMENSGTPYLGVLKLGKLVADETTATTKTYQIVYSAPAFLIEDMGLSGTAKQKLTSALKFQISGKPKRGSVACGQTATVTLATGVVALASTSEG